MDTRPQGSQSEPSGEQSASPPSANPASLWATLTDAFQHMQGAPLLVFALSVLAILLMAGVMWTAETRRVLAVPFTLLAGGGLIAWVVLERKKQIEACLQDPGCILVNDSEGVQGAGRTTWLAKLYEMVSRRKACLPLWVGMADFYPAHTGEPAENPRALLVNNLEEYQRLLIAIASQLPQAQFGGFADELQTRNRDIVTELLQRRIHVDVHGRTGGAAVHALSLLKHSSISTGNVEVNVGNDDVQLLDRLPTAHAERMAALVDGIAEGTHDADATAAMVAGSVVRRFDGELLALLKGADDAALQAALAPSGPSDDEPASDERRADYALGALTIMCKAE